MSYFLRQITDVEGPIHIDEVEQALSQIKESLYAPNVSTIKDLGVLFRASIGKLQNTKFGGHDRVQLSRQLFQWVTSAESPLTLTQLGQALAIDRMYQGDIRFRGLHMTEERLHALSDGLLTVQENDRFVKFIHPLVWKYFKLVENAPNGWIADAELEIAKLSLQHLNDVAREWDLDPWETRTYIDTQKEFFRYIAVRWGLHVMQSASDPNKAFFISYFKSQHQLRQICINSFQHSGKFTSEERWIMNGLRGEQFLSELLGVDLSK